MKAAVMPKEATEAVRKWIGMMVQSPNKDDVVAQVLDERHVSWWAHVLRATAIMELRAMGYAWPEVAGLLGYESHSSPIFVLKTVQKNMAANGVKIEGGPQEVIEAYKAGKLDSVYTTKAPTFDRKTVPVRAQRTLRAAAKERRAGIQARSNRPLPKAG